MAVKYPTTTDVEEAFISAFPTGQPFDPKRWRQVERSILDPTWASAGEGIEVLQANGARLFRVFWEFAIDKMNTSSEASLRSSTVELRQRLATLFNGEFVSFDTPKCETEEGSPMVVRCWTRGIIG